LQRDCEKSEEFTRGLTKERERERERENELFSFLSYLQIQNIKYKIQNTKYKMQNANKIIIKSIKIIKNIILFKT